MGHSVLCLLILAFVASALSTSMLAQKPGKCPLDPCYSQCHRAQSCRPGWKCCMFGCERKCVRLNERCLSSCDDLCVGDHQCRFGTEKCCYKNCRKQCVPAAQDVFNPGSCPDPKSLGCHLCSSNSDCSRGRQCCSDGCKKTCVPTVESLVGPRCSSGVGRICDECFNDGDCKDCKKCCRNACGYRVCVPGVKPDVMYECNNDRDCKPGGRCCPVVCSRMCRYGHCPPTLPCSECNTDSDCCGYCNKCRSVSYHQRKCVQTQQVSNCGTVAPWCSLCGPNRRCPKGKTCCDVGCELQVCVATELDGKCPAPNNRDCCCSDSDCRTGQKCCIDGCGKRCINPQDVSNPRSNTRPRPVSPINCKECENHGDCYRSQRCCNIGCGIKICVMRVILPNWISDKECFYPMKMNCCKSDNDCTDGKKCCQTRCGKFCRHAIGPWCKQRPFREHHLRE